MMQKFWGYNILYVDGADALTGMLHVHEDGYIPDYYPELM